MNVQKNLCKFTNNMYIPFEANHAIQTTTNNDKFGPLHSLVAQEQVVAVVEEDVVIP